MKQILMLTLATCLTIVAGLAAAQTPSSTRYARQEVLIPMRDGVRLNTVIFTPKTAGEPLPLLLTRTPYGVSDRDAPDQQAYTRPLSDEGYIFVAQDIRGRYKSEGTFQMQRFSRNPADPKAIDESTDTYDTIEWLLKNAPNNNGKVGMYGGSYDGWTSVMGAIDPHPALKAISEQASPADMWLGDDFHHQGAFRLSYGFEYAFMEEAARTDTLFPFGVYDTYDWYLKLGALLNVNKTYFHGKLPTWNDFVSHPNYDEFWRKQGLASRIGKPKVAIQNVAGWWDQEDFYGPVTAYQLWEKGDDKRQNHLVVGPWNHGGWARGDGRKLGNISFDTTTAVDFRQRMFAPWFAHHLKGKGEGNFPEVTSFQTGRNQWKTYTQWPPAGTVKRKLYLRENGQLSFEKPTAGTGVDNYISDPAHPVPYRSRPIEQTYGPGSRWFTWLTEDQRFVQNRPDVLSWQTEPLSEDVAVTGTLLARLFAATTGSDADWVVKLIDVYPETYPREPKMAGYQFMVANDILRGRFYKSFEKPQPLQPDKVETFTVDLHSLDHVFLKGHRIMVQVQSSWFPLIDRNPQRYIPNIFAATEADFQKATHRIFRSATQPSHLELSIMPR
ncbi:CocE/NonD family hydrolase [Spirosoma rhododendri]|uniref:CocE/NonD family hydrolase n=1 Tax=Spirosoma rhododendri TaxID=2728024 RepID=A0A7L5DT62_9BACT|nr:CocE/NonD family hydrolase [Spirosoma rhododendri]QJD80631.1 CocE/NonD family hydrolase [Spirosoma rhododendri]